MQLSFKEYINLTEDAAAELAQLTVQRQQLILKKAAADRQIDQQIAAIDKMIFQKERQKQIEDKKNGVDQNKQQQNPNQQQQPQGNQTTTPGSTGSNTPGSSAPANNGQVQ